MVYMTYPAIFYYDTDSASEPGYFISFPDFDGSGTQGESVEDGLKMAADWLGIMLASYIEDGNTPPVPSNINDLSPEKNNPLKDDEDFELKFDAEKSFVTMVMVNVTEYLGADQPVKKTLTIPKWADKLGRDMNINFSQTLTEAIVEKRVK